MRELGPFAVNVAYRLDTFGISKDGSRKGQSLRSFRPQIMGTRAALRAS